MDANDELIDVPPQPKGERGRLVVFWTFAAVASIFVALSNTPYDLIRQSTIMVKGETAKNIWDTRDSFHYWPVDDRDAHFAFGRLGKAEDERPSFKHVGSEVDKKKPLVEIAVYDLVLRGRHNTIKVSYDPKAKRRE